MITLALIGLGKWGFNHLKTVEEIPTAKLKYVCTTNSQTLRSLPGKYIKSQNYRTLFHYQDIDGVIIATPTFTHFQIAKDFLKRNYNLLIEKPLTANYQEAVKLKKIYDQSSSLVLVGHIFRYHPAYLKAKELVKKIGQIKYLDFESLDYGPFRNDISALWDWGPHDIAMCLGIMEKMPLEVAAWQMNKLRPQSSLADLITLRLKFSQDVDVWMKIGWLSPVKRRRITIVGSQSSIIFDDTLDKKVIFFQNLGPRVKKGQVVETKPRIFYPTYSPTMPLKLELQEFINCLRTKKDPKTNFTQALQVLKIIHYAQQSLDQDGKVIKIT